MQQLAAENRVDSTQYDPADPLGFLIGKGKAKSLPDEDVARLHALFRDVDTVSGE